MATGEGENQHTGGRLSVKLGLGAMDWPKEDAMPRVGARPWRTVLLLVLTFALAGCLGTSSDVNAPGHTGAATGAQAPSRSGNRLVLYGLGDSITAGNNCAGCMLFVDLVARDAARHLGRPVQGVNHGESSYDSNQLLYDVQRDALVRKDVARASIVLVMIGINDVNFGNCPPQIGCPEQVRRNLGAILTAIRQIRGSQPTALRVIAYYNFVIGNPDAPTAKTYQASFRADLTRLNDSICRAARDHGATCVDTVAAFNGPAGTNAAGALLSSDHLHPSQRGHQLIAKLIEASGYAPLG